MNLKGRGAHVNPPNRFEKIHVEPDREQLAGEQLAGEQLDDALPADEQRPRTEYFVDASKSVISRNDSPDIPFTYSLNPYRGCMHGCTYCYARPTHEYLGMSAGLDFETKVMVKTEAPRLFRAFLSRPQWKPEPIILSGVTDCYQPAERTFRITRQCLEIALEARQPMSIITKNALVLRDLDVLGEMASLNVVQVNVSISTLDAELARTMEPRTTTPAGKLRAIRALSEAGVAVRVMAAPVIPGLTDRELPAILQAAASAGATSAGYVLLRLPLTVKPVFLDWLARSRPDGAERIENSIRSTRQGQLNVAEFGKRFRGTGQLADQIRQMFAAFTKKYCLDRPMPGSDCSGFRPPTAPSGQRWLW